MVLDHQELYSPLGDEMRKRVRETLLKQHHHQNQKKLANRLPIVRSFADISRRTSELHLDKNGEKTNQSLVELFTTCWHTICKLSEFVPSIHKFVLRGHKSKRWGFTTVLDSVLSVVSKCRYFVNVQYVHVSYMHMVLTCVCSIFSSFLTLSTTHHLPTHLPQPHWSQQVLLYTVRPGLAPLPAYT